SYITMGSYSLLRRK
ncbi:hypothetical protein VN97_g3156, partial [Penicillium thymicola]